MNLRTWNPSSPEVTVSYWRSIGMVAWPRLFHSLPTVHDSTIAEGGWQASMSLQQLWCVHVYLTSLRRMDQVMYYIALPVKLTLSHKLIVAVIQYCLMSNGWLMHRQIWWKNKSRVRKHQVVGIMTRQSGGHPGHCTEELQYKTC